MSNLTLDGDEGDGDDDDATEVSWLRYTNNPQRMGLILLSLVDSLQTIDHLRGADTADDRTTPPTVATLERKRYT